MSKEKEKGYLAKKRKGTGEYEDLYLEGIELLQKLSSAQWTDYNEHDPGVTILENIVYTMTNLSFKTQQPIKDILTESKGSKLESGDNGFFISSDILTTNPVTINDFRKIFIDKITNVKNVWIKTQTQNTANTNKSQNDERIKGLYDISVELYKYPLSLTSKEEDRVANEVVSLFHKHRNLCEDLYNVTIIKPYNLHLKLKLTLGELLSGEEVFANVFFKINDYLTHEVQFYSLWELKEKGEDINSIFNGPLLDNGFINDNELQDRLCCIVPSDIIKIISKVEGVTSVDFFELSHTKEETKTTSSTKKEEKKILIPENGTPVLMFPEENTNLELQHSGLKFFPDLLEVKKQLSYIQAMNYGSFKSVSKSINTIDIPEGKDLGLSYYYPIREQFSLNYGIGSFGLPTEAPPTRQAQAKQLKAYLLPFDQLMSNFLAQLTSLYQLYDTKGKNLHSYFYQELDDMPDLKHLIKINKKYSEKDPLLNWENTLYKLNCTLDRSALQRLNEVADNLLARFGEKFPTYSLRKIHTSCYGKKFTSQQFEDDLLGWKRTLISNYDKLSYNRAKAYDYTLEINSDSDTGNITNIITPGIIQKTAILMGIKNFQTRFISKVIADSGIRIYQKKDGLEILREKLEIIYSPTNIESFELDDIIIIDKKVENLKDSFFFLGNSKNILEKVLKEGVIESNYSIISTDSDKKNYYYIQLNSQNQTHLIHIPDSEKEAKMAIDFSINFLVDLNEKSEGLYLIEHLLLAPPYLGKHFGFSFSLQIDDNSFLEFQQAELESNGDRNNCLNDILNNFAYKSSNQIIVLGKGDVYVIRILNHTGVALAESSTTYQHKQAALNIIAGISEQLKKKKIEQLVSEVTYYAYYGENKVDEEFFSFKMSIILPSWPVRFQDDNFRTKMGNILYEQAPIHIAFQLYWLDLNNLISFEEKYHKWLGLLSSKKYEKERLKLSHEIITIIQKHYHIINTNA